MGGQGWGKVDDEESIAAIRRAFDLGVSFIDTADVYGDGHSEEIIARALEKKRDHAVIATKAGLKSPSGTDFSPAHIVASVEASLARMNTDRVEILQLHNPTKAALNDEELWETLRNLRQAGKIRAYGASVQNPAEGLIAIEKGGVDTVQVVFNVINQSARDFLEAAQRENVGVVARVPLASGFLTGKYTESHRFAPGDYRRAWSPERRREVLLRAAALDPVVDELGTSRARAALAFVLSYAGVSVTIPGLKNEDQAAENAGSSDVAPLPAELLKHLEDSHDSFAANEA
jgi:aryl-alcohol dehydrogenase-like predicted oxidoreductase